MKSKLRVAGCQFSVAGDIESNRQQILAQIDEAAAAGARLVQFPEAALTGYAGVDVPDFGRLDWDALRRATDEICQIAAARKVCVLLGSAHRLSAPHRPHNSVYVISDTGRVIDRYDKRFCTGRDGDDAEMDLKHYSPGDHATIFEVDGHRCGVLICYDYRFPELYRDLKRRGVEVVFQSFHNARRDHQTFRHRNIWKQIVPATMMAHAATNHFWVLAVNSAAKYSMWANFFVRPDGRIAGRLELHEPGVLIGEVDPGLDLWDASAPWRDGAMQGILHSGELVDDPRSRDRTEY
ncbi:MAG TPA: carbon-nitrogen hydrolase family protein [Pirellulales bacterium]|nr:carbon-nitrogen hydrolase family protein [Pirellulales bacterium]